MPLVVNELKGPCNYQGEKAYIIKEHDEYYDVLVFNDYTEDVEFIRGVEKNMIKEHLSEWIVCYRDDNGEIFYEAFNSEEECDIRAEEFFHEQIPYLIGKI